MPANYLTPRTIATSLIGLIALGVLLFVPAGTLAYWRGWVFVVVFAASTQAIGIYLALKDPSLLARRMQAGPGAEQRMSQRIIISLGFLSLLGVMVFCALDYRFGWSPVPAWVSILGDVLVALGLFVDLLVMRENTFGASNIRVEEGQTVITTGPYAIARHPMYAGVLIMMVGVPLALGSWLGLLVLLLTFPVLVWLFCRRRWPRRASERLLPRIRLQYTGSVVMDRHNAPLSDVQLRVRALESLLLEKGLVDPAALDELVDTYETRIGPRNGAQVVARAWADPDCGPPVGRL
jgi:protein-S-isoprenylcysteine O-methyltransferase Ste14